jgi:hypothetical protein
MTSRSILRTWVIAAACCTLVAALIYAMMPMNSTIDFRNGIAYFLIPGIAAYTLLNGSLLFGSGFGSAGNFLVIVVGSGLAWSFGIALVVQAVLWLRPRRTNHPTSFP